MAECEVAAPAAREAALWVAIAHVAAAFLIGIGQVVVVSWVIRAMLCATAQETAQRDRHIPEPIKERAKAREEDRQERVGGREQRTEESERRA